MSDPNEPSSQIDNALSYPALPDSLEEWADYPDIFARVMHHALAAGFGYVWFNEGTQADRYELLSEDGTSRITVPMSSIRSDPAQSARNLWIVLKG